MRVGTNMAMGGALTPKQAKFVKGIAEGKAPTISAQESYNTKKYNTAASIASENLTKPNVKLAIEQAMTKLNLTAERALKPIDDALDSQDLDMRLKGTDRWIKLLPKETKEATGNTYIFNKGDIIKNKYVKD